MSNQTPFLLTENFPSILDTIESVKNVVLKEGREKGFNAEDLFDVEISLEEALYNAIVHGNGLKKSVPVSVKISVDEAMLSVEITDNGGGFDVDRMIKIDCTRTERLLRGNGRGLFIIRKSMDKVDFSNDGRTVHMEKINRNHGNPENRS